MIDAMGRVAQIQATLLQLSGTAATRATAAVAAPAAPTAAADEFAATLASALGTPSTTDAALDTTAGATGTAVAAAAQKYLGVPYVFGGEDSSGMDCSGLVQRVFADLGVDVPRLVSGQMKIGTEVGSLAEAKAGDLIVTGGGAHILIYAGDNKVIHAPYPGRTVCLVEAYMTDADIDTIRRVVPSEAPSAVAGAGTDMLSAAFAALVKGIS